MANPTLLTRPLCENADKNTIPPTDAGTSGLFSEEYGWQNINSLPLASGGKAPNRRDFNGVFALLGGIAYACQRGQTFEWDATQDYVVGCVVLDTNDNKRYECISDVTANATPPSADTTHWKEFGTDTTTLANVDLSNLSATGLNAFADKDLSNLTQTGQDSFLNRDFTIIYPNGGSEGSPANITVNSRYVEDNPFPGYYVHCVAEILDSNKWGDPNWVYVPYGYGVRATQLNDDNIVIQTGLNGLTTTNSNESGNPFGTVSNITTSPCRVKIWKIGKIPT